MGDLGTVTRIGQDRSMSVQLDSGKTAELAPEKTRRIDYGYAVESSQGVRADRILATGDHLSQKAFQTNFPKAEIALYPGSVAPALEPVSIKSEAVEPSITQQQTLIMQHDYGIGF